MTGVLFVQAVRSARHGCADVRNGLCLGAWARAQRIESVLQGVARHMLHHQVGQVDQVPRGHKTWHMAAMQHLHDLVLDLKAHDVFCAVARAHHRHFHHHGKWGFAPIGIGHVVDVCHATGMQAHTDQKTIELSAGV